MIRAVLLPFIGFAVGLAAGTAFAAWGVTRHLKYLRGRVVSLKRANNAFAIENAALRVRVGDFPQK